MHTTGENIHQQVVIAVIYKRTLCLLLKPEFWTLLHDKKWMRSLLNLTDQLFYYQHLMSV